MGFQNEASIPTGLKDSLSPCLIKGIPWPDDVVLEWGDDSQMLSYETTIANTDVTIEIGTEDTNKQSSSCKHYKLRVGIKRWESFTGAGRDGKPVIAEAERTLWRRSDRSFQEDYGQLPSSWPSSLDFRRE